MSERRISKFEDSRKLKATDALISNLVSVSIIILLFLRVLFAVCIDIGGNANETLVSKSTETLVIHSSSIFNAYALVLPIFYCISRILYYFHTRFIFIASLRDASKKLLWENHGCENVP